MPAPERTELVEAVTAGAPAARVCGRDPAPGWGSHAEVMRLQRAAGNRAVAREGRRRLQRSGDDPVGYPAPAPPYSPPSPPVPVRPRVPAPAPAPDPAPAPAPACPTPFTKASSFQTLISLVSAAEARLTANGITTPKEQIHALRGIYYGTTWSMDYAKAQGGKGEKSATRNEGFQRFTRPSEEPALTVPVDVRPMLDCGLFEALRDSPEVTDPGGRHVDVGHLVIGLDARFDPAFKNEAIFKASVGPITKDVPMGGTGLECVTWLGDLGGGAASLAIKRVGAPATSASTVFAGSDYGGSINLEGDVAAFVVAGGGAALVAPTFAPGTRLSDALTAYLSPSAPSAAWNTRVSSFLTMYNGTLDASGAAHQPLRARVDVPAQDPDLRVQLPRFTRQGRARHLRSREDRRHAHHGRVARGRGGLCRRARRERRLGREARGHEVPVALRARRAGLPPAGRHGQARRRARALSGPPPACHDRGPRTCGAHAASRCG